MHEGRMRRERDRRRRLHAPDKATFKRVPPRGSQTGRRRATTGQRCDDARQPDIVRRRPVFLTAIWQAIDPARVQPIPEQHRRTYARPALWAKSTLSRLCRLDHVTHIDFVMRARNATSIIITPALSVSLPSDDNRSPVAHTRYACSAVRAVMTIFVPLRALAAPCAAY